MSDQVQPERTWVRGGRLMIADGRLETESGECYVISAGELRLCDGYLILNGPFGSPFTREERRSGAERRQVERRGAKAA